MSKPEPSVDEWLKEAKAAVDSDECGMYLTHNGIVRKTAKSRVREGNEEAKEVTAVEFSYDAEGVEKAIAETLKMPGVYYARVWLNEGIVPVGGSLMYVLIGADIRPRCIDALQALVGKIKTDLVEEREIYA